LTKTVWLPAASQIARRSAHEQHRRERGWHHSRHQAVPV